jgi:hypothetical protein
LWRRKDVHGSAGLRDELGDGARVGQPDRIDAVRAGLEVQLRPFEGVRDTSRLQQEDIHSRVDHEVGCGRSNCPQPLRVGVCSAQSAGGMVCVLEVAARGADALELADELRRLEPVPRLGVDRNRDVHGTRDARGGPEHLL